jgi:hypothetical protein
MLEIVRHACKRVSETAQRVRIDQDCLDAYAASLPFTSLGVPKPDERDHFVGSTEETIAFVLTLDSVNFGSGYFPHLRKRGNMSGYFTIASGLKDRFVSKGPLTVAELRQLRQEDCADIFGQDLDDAGRRELMGLFARALNDLGEFVMTKFEGSFLRVVETADQSVERLVQLLTSMPFFRDVAQYRDFEVPFYKRAQITAADLAIRFDFQGPGAFADLERLTIFADNAVPNVLRVDGILSYESSLARRIEAGELIAAGSEEEVEIRASALHAAELLVDALRRTGRTATAMAVDFLLWNQGQSPRYKASPRHRTRTVFY